MRCFECGKKILAILDRERPDEQGPGQRYRRKYQPMFGKRH